jgi:hypothetical protein
MEAAYTPITISTMPFLVYLGIKKSIYRKMKASTALYISQSAIKETFSIK